MYVAVFKRFEFGFAEHTKIFEKNPGVFGQKPKSFIVRHAVYKTDTAEDDKKKSNASLGRFTHLQAPVSKAHLLFEQWLCRSHASLALWLHRL